MSTLVSSTKQFTQNLTALKRLRGKKKFRTERAFFLSRPICQFINAIDVFERLKGRIFLKLLFLDDETCGRRYFRSK